MKRVLFVFLLIGASVIARAQNAQLANGIAVIVNDKIITIKDVRQAVQEDIEFLQRRYANQPQVFDEKLKTLMSEALETMVENYLVLHEFESLNRPLPESYI